MKVREKGQTIVKEVPVYVDKTDDAACELRNGFVRIHDAAATNTPAGPPTESDRQPAGVSLAEATATVADNYATGILWREQALGCRAFYEELRASINK